MDDENPSANEIWTIGGSPEGTEGEEDLNAESLQRVTQAVVSSTDWTAETILRQLERGNIKLNPSFQRRDAWRPPGKSRFIESLILGLPIPQLVLAEDKRQKGSYIVIDGKQRLLTLRQFSSEKGDPQYSQLRLRGLEIRKDLNGKSLRDLEADPSFSEEVSAFQNQTIRTVVIRAWPNEDFLYLIFLRLNTGSVRLSAQELRQALHPGDFVQYVDETSGRLPGLRKIFNSSEPDFRMRDAELLVRYFAFRNFLPAYRGNLKQWLDETCEVLNQAWATRKDELEQQTDDLQSAIDATYKIFGQKDAFRKWEGTRYERPFNRAVFDIMVFYFSQAAIRRRAESSHIQVQSDFKKLCSSDSGFMESLTATTKSLDATGYRLSTWGRVLRRRLNKPFAIVELVENTLTLVQ